MTSSYEKPKVGIYCRLSDEDRDKMDPREDSRSIQTQKAMLRDYAHQQGWEIFDIYSDDDFSGADANRPDYNRLLDDASKGKFSIVLCKHQSRFTRDMIHVEKYINGKFPEWGIRFVSLLDGADTAVAGNKKSRQINGLVNEWYLEDLSENVRKAYITRKKEGKYLASAALYGYKKDPENQYHLIIDEPAATIVRRIFEMRLDGMSLNRIARALNDEGVLVPSLYKTEIQGINFKGAENLRKHKRYKGKSLWQSSTVNYILQNETYTGGLYQNRRRTVSYKNSARVTLPREEWAIVPKTHEAIVSQEEFEKAAQVGKQRPWKTTRGRSHLFTGKLVCGYCGGSIGFNSEQSGRIYYRCHRRANLGSSVCPQGVSVSEKMLTEAVLIELHALFDRLMSKDDIKEISNRIKLKEDDLTENYERILLEKEAEINKIARTKTYLYQDVVDGKISSVMYTELWEQFQLQQDGLKNEILRLQDKLAEEKEQAELKQKKQEKLKLLAEEKLIYYLQCKALTREMLDAFVDYIVVSDGDVKGQKKIEIYWNF